MKRYLLAVVLCLAGALFGQNKIDLQTRVKGVLPVANGGTGQTTLGAALNAMLPAQGGNNGYSLTTNGSSVSWVNNAPLVTSVAGRTGAITLAEGDITSLGTDLAARALDSAVVHKTGTESISGSKTFANDIVFSGSIYVAGNIVQNATSTPWVLSGVKWTGTSVTVPGGEDFSIGLGSDGVFKCQLSVALGGGSCLVGGGGGGGTWGSITGTLSAQTDLQAALDAKANLASPTFTGTPTVPGYAPLSANNTFVGNQTITGNLTVSGTISQSAVGQTQWSGNVWSGTSVTVPGSFNYSFGVGSDNLFRCQLSGGGSCMPYVQLAGSTMTGLLTTLASATGGAGLNLPHGTAPTAPTNGDVWTTTTGMYVRVNGSTVGPLGPGAVGTVFGRSGTVVAVAGDYSQSLITAPTIVAPVAAVSAGTTATGFTNEASFLVSTGTFTITLPAVGSVPTNGRHIDIVNYGGGVITVSPNGQTLNGSASNITISAGSASAPNGVRVWSDGTNYEAAMWPGSTGGTIVPSAEPVITTTAGQDGIWITGVPTNGQAATSNATTTPTNNTMFVAQLEVVRTEVIGHATINVTTAGTSETFYTCLYNAAGTSLLWSANGGVNGIAVDTFSAAQYTAYPGIYMVGWEQTGTTGAAVQTLGSSISPIQSIVNKNGNRIGTSANTVSGAACPATLGTITAAAETYPAILLEP